MNSQHEREYMRQALALARLSRPSPNPRVGAVVVKAGKIIGRGHHERPGLPHAEIVALREAQDLARGADLYVTLEPCCHTGRTGPCTEAIVRAGIARVFVGMQDPDPRVNGNGVSYLLSQGIEVIRDVERASCEALLEGYSHHRRTGKPLVTLKAAVSLDGHLATTHGQSKWMSCKESRARVHAMRADNDAVLVGIGTVLADDPLLTVRMAPGDSTLRIVLDSRLRIEDTCQLVQTAADVPLLVAHTAEAPLDKADKLRERGVRLLSCPADAAGRIDLGALLDELGHAGVLCLLVEGGSAVHGAFLEKGLAQKLSLFVTPRVLGQGISWVRFKGARTVEESLKVEDMTCQVVGSDILIEGRLNMRDYLSV